MLEYQLDQIKIVNFLLIDKFWPRELFFGTPSKYVPAYTSVLIFKINHAENRHETVEGSSKEQEVRNYLKRPICIASWQFVSFLILKMSDQNAF